MTETPRTEVKRNIWLRGIYMLLMTFVLHLTITVLLVIAVLQFVLTLLHEAPNSRLITLGRNLAAYLQQIVNFLSFAVEEVPFPFNDWPQI